MVVDSLVEFGLQILLRHAYQEVSNQLGDGLSDRANDNLEVGIDTSADLLHENVCAASRAWRQIRLIVDLRLVHRLVVNGHTILVVLLHLGLLRDD